MELELLRALILIANTCFLQNSCEDCPMRELCGKMPCEWWAKSRLLRLESFFRPVAYPTRNFYQHDQPEC